MESRQPQDEQHSPDAPPEAAALGGQVCSAGAQSRVPPLQSSCSAPGPSSAPALSGPGSGLEAPEPGEGSWSSDEEQREVCYPLRPCPGLNYIEQELSQGEVSRSCQGENNSNRTSPQENLRRITIRTVWVNPDYPELLRDSFQEEEEEATPSTSDEQVPAAGTRSPGPGSPRCSPCSSGSQLAAQSPGQLRGTDRQPSRRALQALCTLLWCSCLELQLHY